MAGSLFFPPPPLRFGPCLFLSKKKITIQPFLPSSTPIEYRQAIFAISNSSRGKLSSFEDSRSVECSRLSLSPRLLVPLQPLPGIIPSPFPIPISLSLPCSGPFRLDLPPPLYKLRQHSIQLPYLSLYLCRCTAKHHNYRAAATATTTTTVAATATLPGPFRTQSFPPPTLHALPPSRTLIPPLQSPLLPRDDSKPTKGWTRSGT